MPTLEERLEAGDQEAIEPLILKHMPTAHKYARALIRKTGVNYKADDVEAVAQLAVVQAINTIYRRQGIVSNTYIIKTIIRTIRDYLDDDKMVRLPRGQRMKGIVNQIDVKHGGYETWVSSDELEEIDIFEEMDSITRNPSEKKVLELLYEGYTQTEVANLINRPDRYVRRLVTKFQSRWRRRREE